MKKRLIYSLNCPFTDEVHYIGKSEKGMIRPISHLSNSHSDKINKWVNELKQLGHSPKVNICEYVALNEDIFERERYWISKYLKKGNTLLNSESTHPLTVLPDFESKLNDGNEFRLQLATFVKTKRKKVGLTQAEFASKAGVGLRWLRELEQGKDKNTSLILIIKVLSMFGCTLDIVKNDYSRKQ